MQTGVIVDAFSSGSVLATELCKKGVRLIHVRTSKTPAHVYANAPFNKDNFFLDLYEPDIDKLVEQLRTLQVEFAILGSEPAGHEIAYSLADTINEKLGLPGNGTTLSKARRDKYDMIEVIKNAGLHGAKQIKTSSIEEMVTFGKSLPIFHLVLKPLRSAGTNLVFTATNEQDARKAFETIITTKTEYEEENTEVCVQEFLVGDEYAVDTVSCNGKTIVTDIWKYHLSDANGVPSFYDYHELLDPNDPALAAMKEYTVAAIQALGIMWGPAHPEIMMTKEGPALIEVGARLAGSGMPKLAAVGLGHAQLEATVAAYTNPQEFNTIANTPVILQKHCIWVNLISHVNGTLKSLEKFSQIEKLPSFYSKTLEINIGEPIKKTVDLDTTPGFIFLVHEDMSVIMQDYQVIRTLEENGLYEVA